MWLENFKPKQAAAHDGQSQAAINNIANGVQWLIVPRHPQRFDEVQQLLQRAGLTVSRRSHWAAEPEAADVWLGDSLGEMALYYGLADVALLGGSFEPLGGQNLIEAAACGCPVVMGPHTFNFLEAAEQALAAGAAQRAANLSQAVAMATALTFDHGSLQIARQAAKNFAQLHQGSTVRLASELVQFLADFSKARPVWS